MFPHFDDEDEKAIKEIMEAFDVDRERAMELWQLFHKTMDDLKKIVYG